MGRNTRNDGKFECKLDAHAEPWMIDARDQDEMYQYLYIFVIKIFLIKQPPFNGAGWMMISGEQSLGKPFHNGTCCIQSGFAISLSVEL